MRRGRGMNANLPSGVRTALVVGGGIYGLSTAWALARRGVAVTVVDAGPLPNPRSSSFDEHRITRHAYGKLEGYGRMMPAAFAVWEEMWGDLGARHYAEIGAAYFLRSDDDWRDATAAALDEMNVGHRAIPQAEIRTRFPMIASDGLIGALETEGAGMLFPARILTDLVVHLSRIGVALRAGVEVRDIDPDAGTVTTTSGDRLAADVVIVCTGPWIDRLVPSLVGVAVPSRQALLYLAPPPELAAAWSQAPVIVTRGGEGGVFTMPPRFGTRLKIGDHRFSRTGDPDGPRVPTAEDLDAIMTLFRASFTGADGYAVLETRACFYTVTQDERFVVGPAGARGYTVSACSGHGFKLAPLIADRLAETVAGHMSGDDLTAYAASRLTEQAA